MNLPDRGGIRMGAPFRLAIAVVVAMSLVTICMLAMADDPSKAMRAFFIMPFRSSNIFLSMLESGMPLGICAIGAMVAFRSGHFSIGGEGQAYAGAFAAALAGAAGLTGSPGLMLSLLAGILAGVGVAIIPALGRRLAGADVLLISFLVSHAAILVIDWSITVPLRDMRNNLVALPPVHPTVLLPRLAPPSALTPMPIIFIALCVAAWFFMERTRTGTMLDLYGKNSLFAFFQGYPVRIFAWAPILMAGGLHGLAGAGMALGANGTAVRGMSGGVGWSAIGVALVAGNRPIAIPLAAFLFAWLDAGGRQAAILAGVHPDLSMVIKAIVIVLVTMRPVIRPLSFRPLSGQRRSNQVADNHPVGPRGAAGERL
jgi:simple sugar transport system permease protein